MFSKAEKQQIAAAVEALLRAVDHPEMPGPGEPIHFTLHVEGRESWSFADIRENRQEDADAPIENPWNESARAVLALHAQRVAAAVAAGDDPKSVVTDDPTGDKARALGRKMEDEG